MISLANDNSDNNGRGLWKYNSSLVYDEFYVENMKKLITKINTSNEFLEDAQMKWVLKYEIRKFTIDYSKTATKIREQHKIDLEHKLKNLENNLTYEENEKLYNHYKTSYFYCRRHKNKEQMRMVWAWQEIHKVLFKPFKTESGNLLLKKKK